MRAAVMLEAAAGDRITGDSPPAADEDLLALGHRALRRRRREMQIVFQDPYSSLSPRQVVEDIVAEPLDVYRLCATRGERRERVIELLRLVGLDATHRRR
jgi:ABC-type microcin C transport system duplicated ATPase subunit YejF